MSKHMRGQGRGSGLPPEPDRSAEFAIPKPEMVTGQAWHGRAVRQCDRRAFRLSIGKLIDKRLRVFVDLGKLLDGGCSTSYVVGRPSTFERGDISRKVMQTGAYELHRASRSWHRDSQ